MILRGKDFYFIFSSGITALTSLEEVILQTRAGHHYLTGGLYTDASFSTLLNPTATVNTPDDLYMSVSMSSWDSSLNIILEQCWATPNRSWLNIFYIISYENVDSQARRILKVLRIQPKK